jgi:hypothetical protein
MKIVNDNNAQRPLLPRRWRVFDQSLNHKTNIWITSRQVAWAWNQRGKPLSNLTPRGTREIKR